MNVFWFLAAAFALYVALALFTGRFRLNGIGLVDRDIEPGRYWLFVAVFSVGVLIFLSSAIVQSI